MPFTKRSNFEELLYSIEIGDVNRTSKYLKKTAVAAKRDSVEFVKALLAVVERNNLEIAKMFVAASGSLWYGNKAGEIAVCKAAELGYGEMVGYLLSTGVNAYAESAGCSLIGYAARCGNIGILKMLIAGGVDVNYKSTDGSLALSVAVANGHIDCVKLLLNVGANVNERDNYGTTPLIWAADIGYDQIVDILIKAGADVNAANDSGTTPLHCGVNQGYDHIVDILIKAGADAVKTYSSSEWGLSFKYPATWNIIFENDTSGSWSIPITVGGKMHGGQRPAFMVNARRDEMITPPHVTVTQALVDGSFHTSPHSPMEHNEDSKKSLPMYFDDIRFMDSEEVRLNGGVPAAWMVYSYSSSGGSVTELSVTAFCKDITYQLICDMPSSEQDHYMVIFGEILESLDITYPPIEITWTVPENIRIYSKEDSK